MTCPSCTQPVHQYTRKCEVCGYAFGGKQEDMLAALSSIDRSLLAIKKVLIWWAVLTLVTIALVILYRAMG